MKFVEQKWWTNFDFLQEKQAFQTIVEFSLKNENLILFVAVFWKFVFTKTPDCIKSMFSCLTSRILGVRFLVKGTIEEDVKYFEARSESHETQRDKNAHASTEENDEKIKDQFFHSKNSKNGLQFAIWTQN